MKTNTLTSLSLFVLPKVVTMTVFDATSHDNIIIMTILPLRQYSTLFHCSNVILNTMATWITGVSIVAQHCVQAQAQMKENIKNCALLALCAGNSPVIGEFPAQRASNAKNVSFKDVIVHEVVTLKQRQNCLHFTYHIFKCILFNKECWNIA